jgi:predicted nucleotide-binding protein
MEPEKQGAADMARFPRYPRVFIVHGHDQANAVLLQGHLLIKWHLEPVVLAYRAWHGEDHN